VLRADSIAECGYPAFRIDLPGREGLRRRHFYRICWTYHAGASATRGSHGKELVNRLTSVIVGTCAGSVSSIFAAAASRECKDWILLDPTSICLKQAIHGAAELMTGPAEAGLAVSQHIYDRPGTFSCFAGKVLPVCEHCLLFGWRRLPPRLPFSC